MNGVALEFSAPPPRIELPPPASQQALHADLQSLSAVGRSPELLKRLLKQLLELAFKAHVVSCHPPSLLLSPCQGGLMYALSLQALQILSAILELLAVFSYSYYSLITNQYHLYFTSIFYLHNLKSQSALPLHVPTREAAAWPPWSEAHLSQPGNSLAPHGAHCNKRGI